MRRRRHDGQGGFTLIEIIAVLVLLGILAAYAIPKYISLEADAGNAAAEGGLSAAMSALSMGYAASILNTSYAGTPSSVCQDIGAKDLTITCNGSGWNSTVSIDVSRNGGGNASGNWSPPS